jgi:hypothetical protein
MFPNAYPALGVATNTRKVDEVVKFWTLKMIVVALLT